MPLTDGYRRWSERREDDSTLFGGDDLHQKNLFLITITSAHSMYGVDGSLPRLQVNRRGYQLTKTQPRVISAQASMLLVSSWTMPPGLLSQDSMDESEERIELRVEDRE